MTEGKELDDSIPESSQDSLELHHRMICEAVLVDNSA
jgi:hypothetical protein